MPSLIEEHTQFEDDDGLPIVSGKVYIGTQNNDPKTNLITIYSDRDLTTMIANPQLTDSSGRTVNKIWVPGKYSIQVDDTNDVQKYQELDAGADEKTGIVQLDNVQGTNTITAEGRDSPVSALIDKEQYNFRAVNANTGAVTLQIDLTTAKTIKKLHDVDLTSGDIEVNQTVSVVYNVTDDVFELVSNTSNAAFSALTATDTFIYKGETQPAIPAQIANHIRAGNMQLINGDTLDSSFDIIANVTENTFETVGPTGSGATNIWTQMDQLPASATILICDLRTFFNSNSTIYCRLNVYATEGDAGTPPADARNEIGSVDLQSTVVGQASRNFQRVLIPLGPTNQDFKITWTDDQGGAISSAASDLLYRGFITDA